MKRFLLTTVTFGFLALPAVAADLAPVYHEPIRSWTGFYFGGTVGGGWMTSNSTESVTSIYCLPSFGGCPADGQALAAAIPGSYTTVKGGFLAGAEAGYNWQLGQFVVGIETDLSGSSISGSSTVTNAASVVGFPGFAVAAYGVQSEKLDYFGTIRGRAGYLVMNPLLAYVTGGFAYGDASSSNSLGTRVVGGPCLGCSPGVMGESSSSKQAGWTIGGGLEWMFAPNFTVKGEYLYYNFGSVSFAGPTTISPLTYGAYTAATADFKGSVVRVGLNFKL